MIMSKARGSSRGRGRGNSNNRGRGGRGSRGGSRGSSRGSSRRGSRGRGNMGRANLVITEETADTGAPAVAEADDDEGLEFEEEYFAEGQGN